MLGPKLVLAAAAVGSDGEFLQGRERVVVSGCEDKSLALVGVLALDLRGGKCLCTVACLS